ncbi:MAG: efflux RND transporter periplasmic adaptor subunit [Xanthomonadales bacterium PRO7]|nr:efflux RND transporter periplasmic adaptor subunit [Xanthomonadales bacterium PRO7]
MRPPVTFTARRWAAPLAALALLAACGREPAAPKPLAPSSLAMFIVASDEAPREQAWDGVVEAVNETKLAAQTNARVKELPVDIGDRVAKGDVLVRFTDVEQSSAQRSAQASVASARAAFDEAQANYKRIDDIYARKLVSRADFDQATARRDAAQAALAAAQAQLRSAGQQADYTIVRAPFAGVVTQRYVEVGQAVQSGPPQPQPLLALAALDALRVEVTIPQSTVEAVRQHPVATLILDGGARRIAAADVTVLPTADATTHTFRVRVAVPAGAVGLWPGMTVKVGFAADAAARLAIPVTALVQRGELDGVYVIGADNTVSLRQLRLGHRHGGAIDVLAGLAAGEHVASDPVAAARWLVEQHAGKRAP